MTLDEATGEVTLQLLMIGAAEGRIPMSSVYSYNRANRRWRCSVRLSLTDDEDAMEKHRHYRGACRYGRVFGMSHSDIVHLTNE